MRAGSSSDSNLESSILGRESELSLLTHFLGATAEVRCVSLVGDPGIGKTTLWQAAIDTAAGKGLTVLAARPSLAEAQMAFAGLTDLLENIELARLDGIPAPQLHALEVATLRKATPDVQSSAPHAAEPRAIASGLLNALRMLSQAGPVLIAIDDVQFLDPESGSALAFAARRIGDLDIRLLLTRRPRTESSLEKALDRMAVERVHVSGLSLGAIRRLLSDRLGLSLSRRHLNALYDAAGGNPLFALELGRATREQGGAIPGGELPLTQALDDLFGARARALPPSVRAVLLAVAVSGEVRRHEMEAALELSAIDDALASGLLAADGDRLRPSHPLLAAAVRRHSSNRERREIHLALAQVVDDETLRSRHLALSSVKPDSELAARIDAAAREAFSRGARMLAVELCEHALRLTPVGAAERVTRTLALAERLFVVGELGRLSDLLVPLAGWFPAGVERARAYLLIAEGDEVKSTADFMHYLDLALAEAPEQSWVRATVLAKKAHVAMVGRVERIRQAEAWALEALEAAAFEPEAERLAFGALAWARAFRGQSTTSVMDRFERLSGAPTLIADWYSPGPPSAQRLVWRGEMTEAYAALNRLLSIADEQGEAATYTMLRFQVCDLDLRGGRLDAANRFLDEFGGTDRDVIMSPNYEFCQALLGAYRGEIEQAEHWAAETIARAHEAGIKWDELEALRALGMVRLLRGRPDTAAESLRRVWEHTSTQGVEDPGAFPVAPDLVEALTALGELGEARAVADTLLLQAQRQEHPWGLASGIRCEAMIRLAASYADDAAMAMETAAEEYERLSLHFDRARTLLQLGRFQRRHRKRGAARDSLARAAAAFDDLGSPGWAAHARSELARVDTRHSMPEGQLTAGEQRVVALVEAGLSNKEIARQLFVSVHTVELHLSHAYAKFGVHSRSQLGARLRAGAAKQ